MEDREVRGPQLTWQYNMSAAANTKFPFTSRVNAPANELYSYQELLKRVTVSMNHYNRDVGNIIPWIMQDLKGPNAGPARDLLPKLYGEHKGQGQYYLRRIRTKHVVDRDYVHAYYDISECCKKMLKEKIERAQRQYAHDLAMEGNIDILVTWSCKPNKEDSGSHSQVVMGTQEDVDVIEIASNNRYNHLDWDKEHYKDSEATAKQRERHGMAFGDNKGGNNDSGNASSTAAASSSRSPPEPIPVISTSGPSYRGGFYTVVTDEIFRQLLALAPRWAFTITPMVEPKRMTTAELAEMNAYYIFRNLPGDQYQREVYFRKHGSYPETTEERERRVVRDCERNLEERLAASRSEKQKKMREDGPSGNDVWGMLFK